ncbi:MAG: undecaprenyl-diphosphate phosphatase [Synechococcaceae cyanobacterium SM2_3_1]|nr:undecaprenyl-diphosphate phosphatase [Synechococcaceae cyanobacterium SM2_3_1]
MNILLSGCFPFFLVSVIPNWWQALILGMVQGLTEFLPISSTAHLRLAPALLGWEDAGASFSAVIQLGSLVAVFLYFAEDLRTLILESWKALREREYDSEPFKILVGIMVGTLPIVIEGIAIKLIWGSPPRQLTVIALASIGLALLLAWAEKVGRRERGWMDLSIRDGIWVGIAQGFALIPGVSRSGATITAGLFLNLSRETAARFAFLLGIPALMLAGVVEFVSDFELAGLWPQLLGTLSAFIFSYLSIDWLLKFLQRSSTAVFIAYRVALGVAIFLGLATGILRL